jgi:hypothetical protein
MSPFYESLILQVYSPISTNIAGIDFFFFLGVAFLLLLLVLAFLPRRLACSLLLESKSEYIPCSKVVLFILWVALLIVDLARALVYVIVGELVVALPVARGSIAEAEERDLG